MQKKTNNEDDNTINTVFYNDTFNAFLRLVRTALKHTNYMEPVCLRYEQKYLEQCKTIIERQNMTDGCYDSTSFMKSWLETIHDSRHVFLQMYLAWKTQDDESSEWRTAEIPNHFEDKMVRYLKEHPECSMEHFRNLVIKEYSDLQVLVDKVVRMEKNGTSLEHYQQARAKVYSHLTNMDFADFDYVNPHFEIAWSLLSLSSSSSKNTKN
jgi:hypothetical protein